jgi:peptide/nickel transport system substrate-binding protein
MIDLKQIFLAEQKRKFASGQIDRRTFIMGATAAGLALPAAMSMADQAMAASPKSGGDFRMGMGHGSTTDSLDPGTYENGMMTHIGNSWGGHLTEVGQDGQLRPDLCESYESADAKTWVFKIRKGVEFHNGKTLEPSDVVASLNYHRGDDSKSAIKGNLAAVDDIRIDGDNVVVELNGANADFPFIVSDYHAVIMPAVDGKVDPTSGIGTGAYILENFEPGVRFIGRKNPNYWKSGAGHFDTVEILSIIDPSARQAALMSGQVHAIDRIDPKTVALMARNPGINILEITGTLHYTMPMRLDVAPFDNYDLRMAMKLSIKRQEMVDKILLGHGALGNDHPISTANRYHASNLPQREFDADKAAFHYKKSGHSGTIQLSASDAAFAGAVDAAVLAAASAKEAGIDIEVVREPKDGYWSNVWNKKGWCMCYWGGRPTEDWMFSSAYVDTTEWNDTAWKGTDAANRFNAIVKNARAELDETKRAAMYAEAQTLIHDDGGSIVPMFANYIMGISKKVAHSDQVAPNWEMDGHKATERWWMA